MQAALLPCFVGMPKSKKPAIGGRARRPAQQKPAANTRAGSPSKPEPAIGGDACPVPETLTDRYYLKSQSWVFFFTQASIKNALAAVLSLNKSNPFLLAGSHPLVEGERMRLTWKVPVSGKSVYGHFRKRAPKTLGPNGICKPSFFSVAPPATPTSPSAPADVCGKPGQNAAIGAGAAIGAEGYQPLPDELAGASFDGLRCWDVQAVKAALEEFGFVVLRGFIPERINKMALDESQAYFLGVLKSFQHGFSIDQGHSGFDEISKLPSFVWEKTPKKEVVVDFAPGGLGMLVDRNSLIVEGVGFGGQAEMKGVRRGWAVTKLRSGEPLADVVQPLAEAANRDWPGSIEVTFQPPAHYSPLAESQKWGVFSSRGYQPKLGLGKCTDAINFASAMGVMNAQLWMRNFLAELHCCLPTELCWQPDGVSCKAGVSFARAWRVMESRFHVI